MNHLELFSVFVNGIFGLLGMVFVAQKNARALILTFTVAASLTGFLFHFGTLWNPMKVMQLCCFLFVICYSVDVHRCIPRRDQRIILLFLLALAASLLDAYFLVPPPNVQFSGGLQGYFLRPIVQTYTYVSTLAILAVGMLSFRQPNSIRRFLGVYFVVSLFAAGIGWLQFVLQRIGIGFLPILRAGGRVTQYAAFSDESGGFTHRLYAFAGEPKQLAAFLLPSVAMLLVVLSLKAKNDNLRNYAGVCLAITLPVLILTYSTAGLVGLASSVCLLVVLLSETSPASIPRLIGIFVVTIFVAALAKLVTYDSQAQNTSAASVVYDRSFARLSRELSDRTETKALDHIFFKRPESLVFGFGPGMYNYHLEEMTMFDLGEERHLGVKPINSGWVSLFVDVGFVGSALMLVLIGSIVKRGFVASWSIARGSSWQLIHVACIGGIISSICMNAGTGTLPLILLFCAATLSSCRIIAIQNARSRESLKTQQSTAEDLRGAPVLS